MDWKLALPLHPEYRTCRGLVRTAAVAHPVIRRRGRVAAQWQYSAGGGDALRIPVSTRPICSARAIPVRSFGLKRMMAMRHYMRSQTVEGVTDTRAIDEVGLSVQQVERDVSLRRLPIMKIILSFPPATGNGARCLSDATAAALLLATVATGRIPNSTCSTVAVLIASISPKYVIGGRGDNANPQSDWPVDGVSDDEL